MIRRGHVLDILPAIAPASVDCVVTSPPYWKMRDYPIADVDWPAVDHAPAPGLVPIQTPSWRGQLGNEQHPIAFVAHLVAVFRALRPSLKPSATMFINIGDTYAEGGFGGGGSFNELRRAKGWSARKKSGHRSAPQGYMGGSLALVPQMLALALVADGWCVRSDVIWHKPNCFPGARVSRPTTAHEYVWMITEGRDHYYDADAARVPSARAASGRLDARAKDDKRALRTVWSMSVARPGRNESCAPMPEALAARCITIGCPPGGLVLDPFAGGGTTAAVATRLGRRTIGCELDEAVLEHAKSRARAESPLFAESQR